MVSSWGGEEGKSGEEIEGAILNIPNFLYILIAK